MHLISKRSLCTWMGVKLCYNCRGRVMCPLLHVSYPITLGPCPPPGHQLVRRLAPAPARVGARQEGLACSVAMVAGAGTEAGRHERAPHAVTPHVLCPVKCESLLTRVACRVGSIGGPKVQSQSQGA
jgi:hypothetical protein